MLYIKKALQPSGGAAAAVPAHRVYAYVMCVVYVCVLYLRVFAGSGITLYSAAAFYTDVVSFIINSSQKLLLHQVSQHAYVQVYVQICKCNEVIAWVCKIPKWVEFGIFFNLTQRIIIYKASRQMRTLKKIYLKMQIEQCL